MANEREIVITGVGVVSPIGIGNEPFWESLCEGRSGVRRFDVFEGNDTPSPMGASIEDFDPKKYVRPRKSLKMMSRDIQLGVSAAELACKQAVLDTDSFDPERMGIVFGADMIACQIDELHEAFAACMADGDFDFKLWGKEALARMFPLWMLKYLPNMPACHIGIAHDLRGPNNTLTLGEMSSLAAVGEAWRVIKRGQADAMVAGGTSSRIQPTVWAYRRAYHLSERLDDPQGACRPFDATRDGTVHGEGAGAFVLEEREHAERRGAIIIARILGCESSYEPQPGGKTPTGEAIVRSIQGALRKTGLSIDDLGYINADGLGTPLDDKIEAQAIHKAVGDIPVTGLKSLFGDLGAGTGAVEMAASVLALKEGLIPFTRNYQTPDPECPVNVVSGEPAKMTKPYVMVTNHSRIVQAASVVLGTP
ncbi:MAG: beta-ketoacyl-[acyl-carrier-protein] synthase family protein [Planctomycetota bacterium]|nr:beta-ketoacyl-[acyl-carrier-protein] synthase family protein [Planctomycetota bacterium]